MTQHDVSRRDFLKRGAILGGAVIWTTPVVQAIGIRPALAEHVSGHVECDKIYAIKIEIEPERCGGTSGEATDGTPYCCEDITGQSAGGAHCISAPPTDGNGCSKIESVEFVSDSVWTVTFVEGCQYQGGAVGLKSGAETPGPGAQNCTDNFEATASADGMALTFEYFGDREISHVEFAFCCSH